MRITDRFAGDEHDSAGYSVMSFISVFCALRRMHRSGTCILTFGNAGESSLCEEWAMHGLGALVSMLLVSRGCRKAQGKAEGFHHRSSYIQRSFLIIMASLQLLKRFKVIP